MNSRVKLLLSLVRDKCKALSQDQVQDEIIYMYSRLVINDIIFRTKCLKKSVTINLVNNQSQYDISEYALSNINATSASWQGSIDFIGNDSNRDIDRRLTGSLPRKMYRDSEVITFYPAPSFSSGSYSVILYATQDSSTVQMDKDTPPEISSDFDKAIILGIATEFIPDYKPLYDEEINSLLSQYAAKQPAMQTSTRNII